MKFCAKLAMAVAGVLWMTALPAAPARLVLDLPDSKGNPRNGEGDFIRLNDGRILFAYTEYTGDSMLDHAPAHIVGCFSRDEGKTWGEKMTVESDPKGFFCYFSLLETKDGLLLSYYNKPYLTGSCVKKVRYAPILPAK